jgi:WLM domain
MVRPRTLLLSYFPPGTVTHEQVSQALREAAGDVEKAKHALQLGVTLAHPPMSPTTTAAFAVDESIRLPPATVAVINNLSDRQYCCVWSVEVFDDGYRPEVARALLAQIARHVNPILRERGWRVKRLMESASSHWIGCCTGNGRNDADAASTNIQLNLRVAPNKHCPQFRSFSQILAVMLHEITHTSIGLEDIHP